MTFYQGIKPPALVMLFPADGDRWTVAVLREDEGRILWDSKSETFARSDAVAVARRWAEKNGYRVSGVDEAY